MRPKLAVWALALALVFSSEPQRGFGQTNETGDGRFGGEYPSLRAEQRALVDDWFERFSRAVGNSVTPQEGYDNLPLSVRTTFSAVTHALLQTGLTDSSGSSLGDSALAVVGKVDTVAGQLKGSGGDKQFRVYVELAPGVVETLGKSREFDRKADNIVYHKAYPICFRSRGGTPSIQFSISRDESRADIDVDYRSSKFPVALFNGHLSASNSDVRAGNNDEVHNDRWSGLQNWWRNLLGLPYLERPRADDEGVIPHDPRVRAKAKPEDAVYDFLNSWLVEGAPNRSVPYFSERAYACMAVESGHPVDRGMARYVLLARMQSIAAHVGKVGSLADVSLGIRLTGERVRVIQQRHHAQFVLYDVREDLAQEFLCENRLESAEPPSKAVRSIAFGKYVAAVFRLSVGEITGETVATLWAKERGYWKLISYEVEPEFQRNRVPNTEPDVTSGDIPPLRYVDGDRAMIRAANDFLEQWLLRRNLDRAMAHVSPSSNACVNLYRADDVPEPSTPAETRALLRKGMMQAAKAVESAKTLEDAIVARVPHHPDIMLVKHDHPTAFVIASLPDYMAEIADCGNRRRNEEPNFRPAATGRDFGTYYAVGFSLKHPTGDPAVLWSLWGREDATWKVVSYLLITP
jgi:hypothetical protein